MNQPTTIDVQFADDKRFAEILQAMGEIWLIARVSRFMGARFHVIPIQR
ncbi:hypothetical protein [Burkholderia ubonensis]|nr:hypothetical protein [Burkholderia ubonensis]